MKKQFVLILFVLSAFSCLIAQQNLKAEYFNGTNFEKYVGTNYVSNIDFYWDRKAPIRGLDPNKCSVRYTGQISTSRSGSYVFSARVDDGIRVWIDDTLIMSNWQLNDVGLAQGKIHLDANRNYDIKIEYFNALLEAEIRLLWELPQDPDQSWFSNWWNKKPVVIGNDHFSPPIEEDTEEQQVAIVDEKVNVKPAPKVEEKPIAKIVEKPIAKVTEKPAPKVIQKPVPKDEKEPVTLLAPTPAPRPVVEETPIFAAQQNTTVDTLLKYIPKNVEFERAKSKILSVSYADLNKLAAFLANNPHRKVKIEGHTDSVGDSAKNLVLSEERAKAIEVYFLQNGVTKAQIISAIGFGGSQPIIPSDGKTHHPENRRVEFILK